MNANTSFQGQTGDEADNRVLLWHVPGKSGRVRKGAPVAVSVAGTAPETEAYADTQPLEAAVTQLASENLSLRHALEEERTRCAELRHALEALRLAAITDPLTGLYNRRAMDQHLSELWTGANVGALSVLMLDIDDFKHINDTYGHPSGDRVIREVAATLRRCLRAQDSAFRYGGEEFMVLLPNTPLEGAISVAESIRGRIEALHLEHVLSGRMRCTVSLGVASRQEREDCVSLFHRVDRALYLAKGSGRNRVVHENLL
jgi:diguanylate cyclase (GGDEF)-like protein